MLRKPQFIKIYRMTSPYSPLVSNLSTDIIGWSFFLLVCCYWSFLINSKVNYQEAFFLSRFLFFFFTFSYYVRFHSFKSQTPSQKLFRRRIIYSFVFESLSMDSMIFSYSIDSHQINGPQHMSPNTLTVYSLR